MVIEAPQEGLFFSFLDRYKSVLPLWKDSVEKIGNENLFWLCIVMDRCVHLFVLLHPPSYNHLEGSLGCFQGIIVQEKKMVTLPKMLSR